LTPTKKTLAAWCRFTPCGKTRFLPQLAASKSNRLDITRQSPRLAARGSTPAASVRSTRGKTWRQKPLDAA
jgi:hypothetical protein